jgi:hypothetical protein
MNQRWRSGRASYRPAGETINPLRYDVSVIAGDSEAKAFVVGHHYSGTYPAARFRFGLHRGESLVGVAVFSVPCNAIVLTSVFSGTLLESVELGRFVLLDDVEGNGETWFLARCFEHLRQKDLRGVISHSDPMPRVSVSGARVFPGHVGTIYQAHNGRYLGRATPRTLRLLPDGQVLSDRAIQKVRAGEVGWRYVVEQLERAGAPRFAGDRRDWLRVVLPLVTRKVKHAGNHRYAWPLDRATRKAAERWPAQAYPKAPDLGRLALFPNDFAA